MWETIWNSILPNILEIILTVISLIVARYVIPYINSDLMPWLKEKRLLHIIKKFVYAAEKMAESGIIQKVDKKAKVIELLESKGITVDGIVDALIESCVKELDIIASTVYEEIVETVVETE